MLSDLIEVADDSRELIGVIEDQRGFDDDIRILMPDGTIIKGIVVETADKTNDKVVAACTADVFPEHRVDLFVSRLLTEGQVFVTHVGVPPNVVTRRWSRLKRSSVCVTLPAIRSRREGVRQCSQT